MIALADKDLISVPTKSLSLGAVAPAHHGAAAGKRADWEVLEPQDLFNDRIRRRCRHEANLTRGRVVP